MVDDSSLCWESHPSDIERWGISASRIRDGAFGGEGLASLSQNWSEQSGMRKSRNVVILVVCLLEDDSCAHFGRVLLLEDDSPAPLGRALLLGVAAL
jgi:hypothetical protein